MLYKVLGGSDDKESACNAGDAGLIPGSGRSPGQGNGNLFQYFCLENSMDRRACSHSPWGCKELKHYWATNTFHLHFYEVQLNSQPNPSDL